jgi:hypothetical protein
MAQRVTSGDAVLKPDRRNGLASRGGTAPVVAGSGPGDIPQCPLGRREQSRREHSKPGPVRLKHLTFNPPRKFHVHHS